jgi:hypothetical protein
LLAGRFFVLAKPRFHAESPNSLNGVLIRVALVGSSESGVTYNENRVPKPLP